MMNKISFRKFVIMALAAAVLIGIMYSFPDLLFLKDAGALYKGIGPIGFYDETVYLGRINAIYRGDPGLRNPAIYEHRHDPVIMPPLSEAIEAGFGKLLGIDAAGIDMIATFFLPSILFFLVALFAYRLSNSAFGSLAAASAVLLGTHLFSRVFLFSGMIFNSRYDLPLWFMRPITPQMHFIFFVLALYFIYKSLEDGKPIFTVMGGIFLGSLFYVSVFYWVYIFAVCGMLFINFMLKKDTVSLRRIVAISIAALAISVPYWMENLKTMRDPNYGLLLLRFNVGFTHKAILPMGALIILALFFAARKILIESAGKNAFYFMSSMLIAIPLTLNQQVLTGKLFKESHWTTYTGKFTVILCAVILVSTLIKNAVKKFPRILLAARAAAGIFFLALLAHGFGMQVNYYSRHVAANMDMQDMAAPMKWLKDNTASGEVILPSTSKTRLSELLPIYTDCYVYYSEPFFCMSLIPGEETRYRMLASYRLFGLSAEEAKNFPYSWDGAIFLTSATNRDRSFMDAERAKLDKEYLAMLGQDGLDLARKYKVDYILAFNPRDAAVIKRLTDSGHRKVYDDGKYSIIRVGAQNG